MNCKSLSIIAALSIAPLFAEVQTGNTFCRIAVTPGTANVMLSIPLSACGTGENIKVTDLVLTTGLTDGTVLKAESASGTGWDVWEIQNGSWVATTTANAETQAQSEDPAKAALSRGKAVWLERPSGHESETIYLYGQVNTAQTSTKVTAGTSAKPVFTLLGNPKPEDFKLSAANWSGCKNDDQILLTEGGNVVIIERKDNVWKKVKTKVIEIGTHEVIDVEYTTVTADADVTVPAGQGFWYRSVGGNPTITW